MTLPCDDAQLWSLETRFFDLTSFKGQQGSKTCKQPFVD